MDKQQGLTVSKLLILAHLRAFAQTVALPGKVLPQLCAWMVPPHPSGPIKHYPP